MSNIKFYNVNGRTRYTVQLSPSFNAEAGSLAAILTFLFEYGGGNDT